MKLKMLFLAFLFSLPLISFAQTKNEWIDSLKSCESQNREDITILDTNKKYSYGGLQFQLGTFMGYGKLYGILPEEFTDKEGLLLIHNPFVQRAIARKMLDDGLWKHWLNCAKTLSAYPLEET